MATSVPAHGERTPGLEPNSPTNAAARNRSPILRKKGQFYRSSCIEDVHDRKAVIPYKSIIIPPAVHAREESDIEMANIQQFLQIDPVRCSGSSIMLDRIGCC